MSSIIKIKIRNDKSKLIKIQIRILKFSRRGIIIENQQKYYENKISIFPLKKAYGTHAFSVIDKANTYVRHISKILTLHRDIKCNNII